MASVTLRGNPINTVGNVPATGQQAPEFTLTKGDLSDVSLDSFAGKKKLISIVPSLDTPVCQTSTQKFNEHAKNHPDTVILIVSADLPFAQGRFCTGESLENVVPLSMMRSKQFAEDYGVLLADGPLAGVTARAVVVVNENNQVTHSELVTEIAEEPDYDAALTALK